MPLAEPLPCHHRHSEQPAWLQAASQSIRPSIPPPVGHRLVVWPAIACSCIGHMTYTKHLYLLQVDYGIIVAKVWTEL